MDFSQFLPRETHKPLAWLGHHRDWLRTSVAADGTIAFKWNIPDKDKFIGNDDYGFIAMVQDTCSGSKVSADMLLGLFYRAAGASLANGPKMFQPSAIQCEAMENVDVDVPFEDYRQPFETLIIQIPDDYRRDAMQRLGLSIFPNYAMVHHDLSSNVITVASNYNKREEGETVIAVLRPSPQITIEDEFRKEELKNEPMVDRLIQRLAVNMCLLLTHYRTRQRALDPNYLEKLKGLARKQDQKKRDRAQTMLVGQFMVVEFEQQIQLHDEEEEPGRVAPIGMERESVNVRPHWRRGHWRRQQHGARWLASRKEDDTSVIVDENHHQVFIKPILVKRAMFAGDKSQTSVLYQGAKSSTFVPPIVSRVDEDKPVGKSEYGG